MTVRFVVWLIATVILAVALAALANFFNIHSPWREILSSGAAVFLMVLLREKMKRNRDQEC